MDLSLYTLYTERRLDFRHFKYMEHPVGMSGTASLLAVLGQAGWDVESENFFVFWDEVGEDDVQRLTGRLLGASADIVGVGALSIFLPMLLPALEAFRRERPDTRVVVGGYGPSEAAEHIIRHCPYVDVVVRGEAEEILPAVVHALKNGTGLRSIPGVCARDGDQVFCNPRPQRIHDLGALPFADFEGAGAREFRTMAVQYSRGCPHECSFCSISAVWGPRVVKRPLVRLMDEMRVLHSDYGIGNFLMADDTFNLSRRRVLEFCDAVEDLASGQLWWHVCMRPDRVDEELLARMAQAGCGSVLYGLETGSDAVLNREKGGFTLERAEDVAWMSARYLTKVKLSFIYGYPQETWDDFVRTVRLIIHFLENDVLNRLKITFSPVFPYPSIPLVRKGPLPLLPVRDPRRLPRHLRAGHALAQPLLARAPALCSYSVSLPTVALEQKQEMAVDLNDVLGGNLTLDDFVRRHQRSLKGDCPPPQGRLTRLLGRFFPVTRPF